MTSVFRNVFRLSGGASVWANVFVLEETPSNGTVQAEFRSRTATGEVRSRTSVAEFRSRTVIARRQSR